MKLRPIIALAFILGFQSLATNGRADVTASTSKPSGDLYAAAAADEDEEDDEEEEQVNYRDRVREVQQWLNRRDSERKGADDATLPAERPALPQPFPKYFQDNGYDERGFRKWGDDVRLRLRDGEYRPHRYYRRHVYRPWRRHAHHYRHFYPRHRHHHSRHGWRNHSHPRHGYSAGKHHRHGAHAHSSRRPRFAGRRHRR
ncbi:MAG: hypothetical protein PHE55_09595 [Methylococcaceae bacterium]|nr:hypothetical protein [Methylococcaceae bacterium]